MITKLEITNFRNISHVCLDLKKCSILTGANGIGKSNTLNALNWLLTNTLLTDKWGTGENDLNSIVPIDAKKGEHTQVSIYVGEGNIKFTKYLKVKAAGGNYTEYKVNEASFGGSEWQEKLFEALHFTPHLKCKKDVNELRVFTDPLYPLQKLEPKNLRQLLVDLGCSVTDEEIFEKYPQYILLKNEAKKYMGDYTKMRQSLKQLKDEQKRQLEALEGTLEGYRDVEEFNPAEKERLEGLRDELVTTIRNLRKGDINLTTELDLQLEKVKSDRNLYIAKIQAENNQKVAVLREQLKQAQIEANEAKNKKLQDLNASLRNLYQAKGSLETTIKAYDSTRETKRFECNQIKADVDRYLNEIDANNIKIEEIKKRQFKGYVTCPKCGHMFAGDIEALTLFNNQKQDDIANLEDENARLNITITEKQKQYKEALDYGKKAKSEQDEAVKKLEEITSEINQINNDLIRVQMEVVDTSKVDAISNQINEAQEEINTSSYDIQITTLENKKNELVLNSAQANASLIEQKEAELEPIKEAIENEYMKLSKYNSKLEFEAKYDEVATALNNTESLIMRVTEFIQKRISMINEKARTLTGIDFVMLEENLTNDNVKEVCYATVDGVEFGNVNTSQKLAVGIQFIHKIKEILGNNDLPILADRLEGFDDLDKIRALTTEQMICTVVGNKNQKEIVII